MVSFSSRPFAASLTVILIVVAGCASKDAPTRPAETFTWIRQPVSFSPPPLLWERQGDNGGGTLGVRFILRGGGGQCISVAAYHQLAERDRRVALASLISRRDALSRREFLRELSLARARTDDPLSDREAATAQAINAALHRAMTDYLADSPGFVASDLEAAVASASAYQPTLTEVLPRIRLRPERMQEPDRWRIGYERDTILSGVPAFVSDDTLITPERPLLYTQIFWVVRGCAFNATFQGTAQNRKIFSRLVDSIRFPDRTQVAAR